MNRFMKTSLWTSIVSILLGLFLVCFSKGALQALSLLVGFYALIAGIGAVLRYWTLRSQGFIPIFGMTTGAAGIVFGVIAILMPKAVVSVIPVLVGVFMLFIGVQKVITAVQFKPLTAHGWIYMLTPAVLMLIASLLLLFNPFGSASLLAVVIGITFILEGIGDIVEYIFRR